MFKFRFPLVFLFLPLICTTASGLGDAKAKIKTKLAPADSNSKQVVVVEEVLQGQNLKQEHGLKPIKGKNILFFIGMAVHSHRTAMEPLAHELVSRGHNVTFLTPIKPTMSNPKVHQVSTESLDKFYEEVMSKVGDDFFIPRLKNKYTSASPSPWIHAFFTELGADLLFTSPEFKSWMESSSFDLVIVEDCLSRHGHAIAYKFNASVILFTPAGFWGHEEETFGIPLESSWLPNYFLLNVFTESLTFYDKVYSTLYLFYHKLYMEWWCLPKLDEMSRRALNLPEMPPIAELERETSLLFTNQYFSNDYARSLPPLVVQVGGMHCKESNGSLSKELEEFIAGAGDEGFIYISFGSIINMSGVPDFLIKILFDAVASFKTRFLWKWDIDSPKNLPSNVRTAKWFPQQDILAHPKIKGFITHGGLMSTQQGVFHGVPMIFIPVIADQPYNGKTAAFHGNGIQLEFSELTTNVFKKAISNIINDPSYTTNAKRASELFRDRPLSPLDTAVYWTEYVLRHKNTSHMKPLAMNQAWWEKHLLDVWLFLLLCFTGFWLLVYKILVTLVRFCFTGQTGKTKKAKIN